jgi:hypothetical protein
VDAWRCNAEEALEIGLGGRLPVEEDVRVDEREVLALGLGEAGCRRAGHDSADLIKGSSKEPS